MRRPLALLVMVALEMGATAAAAQQEVAAPADPYVHRQTGMAFPAALGPFVRRHVGIYTPDGADTGVSYDLNRGRAKIAYVSIFLYPAPPGAARLAPAARDKQCRALFAGINQDVLTRGRGGHLTEQDMVPAPVEGGGQGLHARFTGARMDFAGTVQPVQDEAYLYCPKGTDWLVAYRVTSIAQVPVAEDIARLMREIRWPAALLALTPVAASTRSVDLPAAPATRR